MKGWIKYFADGTEEKGTDRDVRLKQASWRNGRQVGIMKVEAQHDRFIVGISGDGDFWQSDTCEVPLYCNRSRVVCRRIQKKINRGDREFFIKSTPFTLNAAVYNMAPIYTIGNPGDRVKITEDMVDKWLTLELDVKSGEMRMFFAENKI